VMMRNGKWLDTKDPVPPLGDASTPKEEVDAFYEYFYSHKSWREFGYHDKHALKEGQSRDERRWAEKQNKAEAKKKQKEETARMLKLVDNAYASDPRILRFKKAEKRAKLDREEQRKKEKADAQKAKRDKEKAAKEAVEKIERDKAQLAKDDIEAARNARKKFTKQCKRLQIFEEDGADGGTSSVSREQADHLRTTLPTEQLVAIAKLQDKAAFTSALLVEINKVEEVKRKKAEAAKPWSQDEQKLLETALRTVPKSAADRWDQIAACVPGRTKKQCILRVKELVMNAKKAALKAPEEWTEKEESILQKAASKLFPPGTTMTADGDRWVQIALHLRTHCKTTWLRESKDVIAKVNEAKNVNAGLERAKKKKGSVTSTK